MTVSAAMTNAEAALAIGVGVALQSVGPRIPTVIGVPVLKNPIVAFIAWGGRSESKRKLYNVPHRMAFAFWFCAKVSVLQLKALAVWFTVHGTLLNPASPTVPSCGHPGSFSGA